MPTPRSGDSGGEAAVYGATVSDGSRPEASNRFPTNRCAAGDEHATPPAPRRTITPAPRPTPPALLALPTPASHSAITPRAPDNPAFPAVLIHNGTPLALGGTRLVTPLPNLPAA